MFWLSMSVGAVTVRVCVTSSGDTGGRDVMQTDVGPSSQTRLTSTSVEAIFCTFKLHCTVTPVI